jgi:plastocyanin
MSGEIEELRRRVEELERKLSMLEQERRERLRRAHEMQTKAALALVVLLAIIIPAGIASMLLVPGLQPRLSVSIMPGGGGAPGGGGGGGGPSPTGCTSIAATVTVAIPSGTGTNSKLNFDPAVLTVKPCTKVVWVNKDISEHTVTFLTVPQGGPSPSSISSGTLELNDQFSVVFVQPGNYTYHCTFHPAYMKGTIVVSSG